MNIGLISDLHFKIGRGNNLFISHVEEAVDNFIELCKERDVEKVIIGGDVLHVKQSVDTYCLNQCLDSIRKLSSQFDTIGIVGNHETIRRNNHNINLMNVFKSDFDIVTDYKYEDIDNVRFHYMPYFDDETLWERLKIIQIDKTKKNIMFGHFSFEEYGPQGHEEIFSNMKPKDICDLGIDHIYSGHIHMYMHDKRVTYISSPVESHFNEGGRHGYVFFNTDSPLKHEFVDNVLSPKFVEFNLTKDNLKELMKIERSYVSIIINKKLDPHLQEQLKRKVEKNNFYVRIVENYDSTNNDISVIEGWDNYILMTAEDIIEDYVNKTITEESEHSSKELTEEIFSI